MLDEGGGVSVDSSAGFSGIDPESGFGELGASGFSQVYTARSVDKYPVQTTH